MKLILFLKSNTFWLNAVLAVTFLSVLGLSANWILKGITGHGQVQVVPDLTGLSFEEAQERIASSGLVAEVLDSTVYFAKMDPGTVVDQYPMPGATAKAGRIIELTINRRRPGRVALPLLVERTLQRAELDLTSRGLRVGRITYVPDLAEGLVLSVSAGGVTLAEGSQVRKGTAVDLVVGKRTGPPTHAVPNLFGMRFGEAKAILQLSGLRVEWVDGDTSNTNLLVLRQFPDDSQGNFVTHKDGVVRVWIGDMSLEQNNDEQ
ncbi:MAG: PASTA domain-containing protein [Schleiferiaceae bacterium]|nr:PASTA domain-containing protein [Schleiferiaceae bacterium]